MIVLFGLILFGRNGFTPDVEDRAAQRDNVELVDLDRIRHGD